MAEIGMPKSYSERDTKSRARYPKTITHSAGYIADLRPLLQGVLADRGLPRPLCCHPYDLCTILIAEELGLAITNETGVPLDAPLDLEADVSWVGYANDALRRNVEPALIEALRRRGLLPPV